MRTAGTATWHGLATRLEGNQLVAYVDDERFRHGTYQFRAHAVDAAGNEALTGARADGTAASLRLPARIDTRLKVGLLRRVVSRRILRRHGRRRVVLKRVRRLASRVTARHRASLRLTGSLTNADGHPLAGATVEALERQADGSLLPLGFATTGELGELRYVIEATGNRHLVFRYPGSKRIGVASTDFELLVPASSSMRSSRARVRNGEQVVFSGRARTRPVPAAGKLVELQAYFRGRWRTFSTVRTTSGGRWRFPYRFGATFGRVTYRFRVVLPAEGGYPFVTGRSRVVGVVVTGP
jgi:5-hydroxyisourate hydrolase-like protein (transthyretin family)